mgnify:CR=1 FL=1
MQTFWQGSGGKEKRRKHCPPKKGIEWIECLKNVHTFVHTLRSYVGARVPGDRRWVLVLSRARRGCVLIELSICATLGGTISYGDPPTTISSCRAGLSSSDTLQIRATTTPSGAPGYPSIVCGLLCLSLVSLSLSVCLSLFSNHLPPIGAHTHRSLPSDFHNKAPLPPARLFFPNGIESTMMTIIMTIMMMSMIIMVDPRSMSDSTPSWWKVSWDRRFLDLLKENGPLLRSSSFRAV